MITAKIDLPAGAEPTTNGEGLLTLLRVSGMVAGLL